MNKIDELYLKITDNFCDEDEYIKNTSLTNEELKDLNKKLGLLGLRAKILDKGLLIIKI